MIKQLFQLLRQINRQVHLMCQTRSLHCSFALEREPVDAAHIDIHRSEGC